MVLFGGIVNRNSINITIRNIPVTRLCGNHKRIVLTITRIYDSALTPELLTNISKKAVTGQLDGNLEIFVRVERVKLTYDIELPRFFKCQCEGNSTGDCQLVTSYFGQQASYQHFIKDMLYYRDYSVRAHFCNEFGCGEPSDHLAVKTASYFPSCPPINVHHVQVEVERGKNSNVSSSEKRVTTYRNVFDIDPNNGGVGKLRFAWNNVPWNCSNGVIMNFNATLLRSRTGATVRSRTITNGVAMFKDLENYEEYCFVVAGSTDHGMGPFSDKVCWYTDESGKISLCLLVRNWNILIRAFL